MNELLVAIGIPALIVGALVISWAVGRHDGTEPDSLPPFFAPEDDRDIREYHNMTRAEWERTPNPAKARLRDAYFTHLWRI
ncbi:hypothetical protein [Arthrobacter sp. USHLN218]|uniref:hypothetical protein n=1 Tax=Arthrobacter sp. USHLN218 TaxID=3081232 RepID=UPI00301AB1AD